MSPRLSCLVVGDSTEFVEDARKRLTRSSRVGSVEVLADEIALTHEMNARQHDLVVLILGAPDSPLPRCFLKHPQTRVLVVAPNGVRGTLARWLQQGADDLVSPDDTDAYDHALSRLLDACALGATTRRQALMIDVQRQRIEALATRSGEAAPKRPTLSASRRGKVKLNLLGNARKTIIANSTENHSSAPVNELPDRKQTLSRLLALAARPSNSEDAFFALQFTWTQGGDKAQGTTQLDRIVADLAIYRAADALRRLAPQRLLLGRTRPDRLILLMQVNGCGKGQRLNPEKMMSEQMRRARTTLGTLGGLLGSAHELELESMQGSLKALAKPELLAELDARHRANKRKTQLHAEPGDTTVVPMVTNRPPNRSGSQNPRLVAAQS